MKNVVNEYAGAVVALLGTLGIISLAGELVFGHEGCIAILIGIAGQGGV